MNKKTGIIRNQLECDFEKYGWDFIEAQSYESAEGIWKLEGKDFKELLKTVAEYIRMRQGLLGFMSIKEMMRAIEDKIHRKINDCGRFF